MAQNNGFNAMFGIEFEDFNSVKKKLDLLTGQINKSNSSSIKLNIDTTQITKIVNGLSNLSKQSINIMPNGQITTIEKFNQELGKTISLTKNINDGSIKINIDDDIEKAYTKLFDEAIKQEENLAKERQYARDLEWKEAEIRYKQEQEFINASQKLKQKSYQESLKQAQQEAKISNKILEEQYKEAQSEKEQLANAQKLVDYEKERLHLRLESIQANRKDLVSDNSASKISESINNLSGSTTNEVREKVKQLNLELQKLDQNARMKGLQVGNKNIMSFGESIKSTATKLGIFVSTAMVLNEVQQTIRNATNYIIELDKAMVDLKKVTDETSDTYQKFLNNMHDVALELGTQSDKMVEATTNWAKTGKNLEEASKLAENTILLTKVGDIDSVSTAQQYMIAPLKAFNIEAEKSITLIDKYNNISNNMATTVADVGQGLNVASNSLSVARNNLEQSIALIATAESTTKQGGSTVGNALKTISLRLATFKDEDGKLIPELAEDLKKVGVSAVDSAGQIRSTFDILRDLGKVYDSLDTNLQLKLSQKIGGKHQANIVASILSQVEELERAYDLASNSAGSAMSEFEKYQEGIEYALDRLKEQVNGLYTSFIDGGFFKGLVNGSADVISAINQINNTFGTMPTIITTVVGVMTIFNSKFRETTQVLLGLNPILSKIFVSLNNNSNIFASQVSNYTKQISFLKDLAKVSQEAGVSTSGFGKELLNLNVKLATATAKMVATKLAVIGLQTALSVGLSLGLSLVINKFTEWIDKKIVTQDELKQLNQDSILEMQNNNDLIKSVEELIKKEDELKNKLSTKGNTYEQQKQYRTDLLSVQKQIADILPESANAFDNEGNKIATNTEKVLENLEAKKKLSESEALSAIDNNDSYETTVKIPEQYEKLKQQLADMQQAYKDGVEYMGSEVDYKWLNKIDKQVQEYELKIETMSNAIESLRTAGWEEDRIAQEIFDTLPLDDAINRYNQLLSAVNSYNGALEQTSNIQDEFDDHENNTIQQTSNISSLQKAYESLGYSVDEVTDKMSELSDMSIGDANAQLVKDATTAYSEAISKTKELETILKDINEEQSLTPELIMQIASAYPEIGSRITSVADVQEFLNEKISEQVEAQANAYNQMVANDNAYYTSKVQNNDAIQESFNQLLSSFVTNSGESYATDLKNYKNLSELKADLTNKFGETVAEFISNFVTANADGYDIDLDNTVSWAKSKSQILQQLNKNITKIESRLSDTVSKINNIDITDDNMTDLMRQYQVNARKLAQLKTQEAEIQTEFSKYSAGFRGYIPTFSGSDFNYGSTSGSNKGTSSTNKEVDDLKSLVNRYLQVESALDKVNNAIKENQILMENSSDEERLKNLDKEIKLLQEKKVALQNVKKERQEELQELKNSLISSGFTIGSDGFIQNYEQRLEALRSWANSLSGDTKESAKDNVENIADNIDRYMQLLLKDIPEVNNEILDLKNTTIDTQKEIAEILEKQKDNYISNLEKETDALKKEIQKRKDIMNEQWQNEDYEDELKEKQDNLLDLQSQLQDAMRMSDDELVKSIKKQIESAQNEINTFIRDNERDEANDRFDEELDAIDENLENKIEEINNKLTEEEILKLVQNGVRDLSSVLNDVGNANKSISTTFTTVGTIIRDEWLTNLDEVINKLKLVENFEFGSSRSINSNVTTSKAKSIGDINFEINLTVEGGNEDNIPEIKKLLEQTKEEIYKEISDVL